MMVTHSRCNISKHYCRVDDYLAHHTHRRNRAWFSSTDRSTTPGQEQAWSKSFFAGITVVSASSISTVENSPALTHKSSSVQEATRHARFSTTARAVWRPQICRRRRRGRTQRTQVPSLPSSLSEQGQGWRLPGETTTRTRGGGRSNAADRGAENYSTERRRGSPELVKTLSAALSERDATGPGGRLARNRFSAVCFYECSFSSKLLTTATWA